jgi:hypothetical protein
VGGHPAYRLRKARPRDRGPEYGRIQAHLFARLGKCAYHRCESACGRLCAGDRRRRFSAEMQRIWPNEYLQTAEKIVTAPRTLSGTVPGLAATDAEMQAAEFPAHPPHAGRPDLFVVGVRSAFRHPFAIANGSPPAGVKTLILLKKLVPEVRIELTTYPLPRGCATTTLLRHPGAKPPEERRLYPIVWLKGKGCCVAKSPKSPEAKERLAAALRENLKRRKAQARGLARDQSRRPPASSTPESPGPAAPPSSETGD